LEANALQDSVQSTVGDDGDSEAADITYYRYPALDTNRQVMTEYWEEAFKVLETSLAEGKRALVHCHAGKSRSASLIAYYLMKKYDYTLAEAMAHLTKRRRQICINGNFMAQLFSVSKDCD
jgi:protein-tyrosine phosphatase